MIEDLSAVKNGRKFRMGLYCTLLATAAFFATMTIPVLGAFYGTYVGALSAFFAIYCGGNVGNKYVLTRPDTKVIVDRRTTPRGEPVVDPGDEQEGPGPQG